MVESLSRVPLLSRDDQEQADLSLLALANAYGALKAGKLPTTDQLVGGIRKVLASSLLQPDVGSVLAHKVGGGRLSRKGRDVVLAERKVLESIARLVLEKNPDDKWQRFIWQARNADLDVDADVEAHVELPDLQLPSTNELKDAGHSLHELFSLLLTSSELRNLLADSLNLFRDLFADAAEQFAEGTIAATRASKKAARKARPSEQQRREHQTGLEGLAEGEHWEDVVGNVQDVRKQVRRGAEDKRDELLKKGVKKGRAFIQYAEEKLPTDAKDAVIERWKRIANEIQSQPEYSDAINTLYGLARKYFEITKDELAKAASDSTAKLKNVEADPNAEAKNAVGLFRQIVESFTGPLDDALRAADALYNDVKGDKNVQEIWNEFDLLIQRSIDEPGYVTSSKASRRFENIYDRARAVVESNAAWKKDANAFTTEAQKLIDHAANDRALEAVGDAFEDLGDALAAFGKTGYNLVGVDGGDLWKDISTVWLPRILGTLKMVPIPRVEYSSEDIDLIIDNIRFEAASFVPDAAHFKSQLELSTQKGYAAYASSFAATTTLAFAGLRMQATNISYYIQKKTGWIGLEDYGFLDLFIGDAKNPKAEDGLDVTLTLSNATDEDRETFFKLEKVDVNLEGFSIGIRGSQHPIRNWLARGAVASFLEAKVKEVLEEQIAVGFKALDQQIYLLQYKAAGARAAAPDPISYLRALLTPTSIGSSGSLVDGVTSTGITKTGPKGEFILAIGVDETILPGKQTALERRGEDVVSRKRQVESLLEEGRAELVGAVHEAAGSAEDVAQAGYEVGEVVDEESRRARREAQRREREERKQNGWRSQAFDLVVRDD